MEVCVEESRCCIAEWRRGGRKLFPDGDWEVSMNYKRNVEGALRLRLIE